MKNSIMIAFILTLVVISCGQNKARQQQQSINDMTEKYGDDKSKDQPAGPATVPSTADASSSLMGEWTCVLVTGDSNTNGKLDDNERAQGFDTYKDYLKLNPDGTCVYTVAHLDATYEIVEKNGNKSIEVIARDGSRIKQGRIISLTPTELQLMKFSGGRDILVFHRP
jgi:hypothetical protein